LSEAVLAIPPTPQLTSGADHRIHLAGVLMVSFASLLLELGLTRLFSVILFYHFAFLAISIALLGLGAGGVFAYLNRTRLPRWDTRTLGMRLAAANAVLLLVVLEVDLRAPVSVAFDLTPDVMLRLALMYVVSALPFFCTGLLLSVVFARETRGITELYAADLTGGALACLAIVPLLNFLGGPNSILVAMIASAAASAVWARTTLSRRFALVLTAACALLTAANYSGKLIDVVYAKGVRRDKPWVLFARWNAISRVEVDEHGGARVIVIDADASTYIMNTDPHHWSAEYKQNLMWSAPGIVNVLRPRGDYAIIGPGGGVDILRALANGSPSVTAIEINPIIVNDIMRGRWADFSHHLYDQPEVHVHLGDGRSWVRNARQQFDVVQMTLVDTWASTAAGAFALSENNLYTVEAFRQYFDHLKPDGIIAITRWEFSHPREALRVVSEELEVMKQAGISNPAAHFIVVSEGTLDEDGRPVTVLFKKSPFTRAEEEAILDHIEQRPGLHVIFAPGYVATNTPAACSDSADACRYQKILRNGMASAGAVLPFRELIASPAGLREAFIGNYSYDIRPVTDNAPFFFFTMKTRDVVAKLLGGSGRGMDWKNNLGVAVLAIVLAVSLVCVLLFLIVPLLAHSRVSRGQPAAMHAPVSRLFYFIAIGLGYILAEIAFIQRFVLFLGHPTYALTVVIFLMLLASGAGSMLSRHWFRDPLQVRTALVVVVALLLAYILVLPPLLRALVGLPFLLKLMISAAALVPLGLAMGMPFPSGLRALAASSLAASSLAARSLADGSMQPDSAIEWAWALNAASSVLGSVLAIVIAIQFGLNWTLASGALAYLLALALVPRLRAPA
jgi:predicted membrane-bound spermidine synthase